MTIPDPVKGFEPRKNPPVLRPDIITNNVDPYDDEAVRKLNRKALFDMGHNESVAASTRLACIKELNDRIDGRVATASNAPQKPEQEITESDAEILARYLHR